MRIVKLSDNTFAVEKTLFGIGTGRYYRVVLFYDKPVNFAEQETMRLSKDNGYDFRWSCAVEQLDQARQFIEDYTARKVEEKEEAKKRLRVVSIIE